MVSRVVGCSLRASARAKATSSEQLGSALEWGKSRDSGTAVRGSLCTMAEGASRSNQAVLSLDVMVSQQATSVGKDCPLRRGDICFGIVDSGDGARRCHS